MEYPQRLGHGFAPRIAQTFQSASVLGVCYGVEQISYGLFFWPELFKFRPDIVWTKEVPFGYFLPIYRQMLGQDFQTVFANGGAFRPQTYKDFDFIQHLTQESFDEAKAFGISPNKMTTLTNLIPFHEPHETREQIRQSLGYAPEDFVVMTVSALNIYHKRLDYVINEVASMNDSRIKLLMCGHPDAETSVLKALAKKQLGSRIAFKTMSESDVHRAMKGADAFVMASTQECLGNAMAESILAGLPLVVHSTVASRFMLGTNSEWMRDLTEPGELARRLNEFRGNASFSSKITELQSRVDELFGADTQVARFYDMTTRLRSQHSRASHSVPMEFGSSGQKI